MPSNTSAVPGTCRNQICHLFGKVCKLLLVVAKDLDLNWLCRTHQVAEHIAYNLAEIYHQTRLTYLNLFTDLSNNLIRTFTFLSGFS